jgi:hypothetical protein
MSPSFDSLFAKLFDYTQKEAGQQGIMAIMEIGH